MKQQTSEAQDTSKGGTGLYFGIGTARVREGKVINVSVRTLSIFLVALTVVVGCGGGGGDAGGVVPPPDRTRSRPTVSLGTTASMQTTYLSGSSRSSRGPSQVAGISQVRYQNGVNDTIPSADDITTAEVRVRLDGYTINNFTYPVALNGVSGRSFGQHPLEIRTMYEIVGTNLQALTPPSVIAYVPPAPFDTNIRLVPGRISAVTLRVDEAMVSFSTAQNRVVFNTDQFVAANYDTVTRSINSNFNGYVAFDISGIPSGERPTLLGGGGQADRVFYSGDGIAMSQGMGDSSNFQLIDPVVIRGGKVSTGPLIGPTGQQTQAANVFVLDDETPSNTAVTSLVGSWKNWDRTITPTDTYSAVAFPSSRETDNPSDIEEQQFVIFRTSGTTITAMWQGQVFYNTSGNPTRGTFRLFPIGTIDDAVPSVEVTGTVSNLVLSSDGFVRGGEWDVVGTPPGSWTFPALGGFTVYRR